MRLFCTLGWHSPGPQILWNAGFWFTKCRDCERDLVRSRHRGWHVPVGAKVVWQAKAPAPRPPAAPAMLVEPPGRATAIDAPAPDILVEAGKPPRRNKRAKPADPTRPAHLAAAPEPVALIEPAETAAPVELATPAHGSEPSQSLAPAERLDLAQFVAEMLHSAGPAVPIQHAVLDDEPGQLADSEETEPSHATAIETDAVEALVSHEAGAEGALHESGEAAEDLAQTLVADPPAPLELDEPLELVGELDPDQLDADQLDAPEGEAPEADREAGDAGVDPVGEAELAQGAPPHPDGMALDPAVDPAATDAEAPASSAATEPVPAAAAPAPAPVVETDPWADFLDDDDDDDDDFAWAQESRPESPAAPGAAPERPAAPRAAPERPAGGEERRGAQRLNEPFRSDIDGRKHWSKNSVKR